jgi:hypothetical protein
MRERERKKKSNNNPGGGGGKRWRRKKKKKKKKTGHSHMGVPPAAIGNTRTHGHTALSETVQEINFYFKKK